ncbi:hypothetical protein HY629_00170 [Candidatus Uhrbacteria bacterium]|nr:hypothetical protein [Candidatus Uhrbacteria bacterium]
MKQRFIAIMTILVLVTPLITTSRAMPVGLVVVGNGTGRSVWYVDPKRNTRYCLEDATVRTTVAAVGVKVRHTDILKIPKTGQRLRGNMTVRKKYAGRILLDVDRQKNAWYVHPVSRVRYPLYTAAAVKQTIAIQAAVVTPKMLNRIRIGSACAPALVVRVEPTPLPPSVVIGEPTPAAIPTLLPSLEPSPLVPTPIVVPSSSPVPSATPLPTPTPCAPSTTELRADDSLCLLNERRRSGNVTALTSIDGVLRVATRYAEIIRARADFRTPASNEPTVDSLFADAGYTYGAYSAFFGVGHKTAEQMVTAIVGSDSGTSSALLDPDYRDVGIGIVLKAGDKPTVWTVIVAESKAAREEQLVAVKEAAAAETFANPAAVIQEIVDRTNAARAACEPTECPMPLSPLTIASLLNTAAQGHADDMKARAFYGHENPSGEGVGERATRAGYTWSTVAENIACGQESAAIVVDGWLKSPGHRHNIMNADITEIGIGFSYGRNVPCGTEQQLFTIYWAQNFGKPR